MSYNFQAWNKEGSDREYTPFFIDLVDNYNQQTYYKRSGKPENYYRVFPDDDIHLPVAFVQNIVFRSNDFSDVVRSLLALAQNNPSYKDLYGLSTESVMKLVDAYEFE